MLSGIGLLYWHCYLKANQILFARRRATLAQRASRCSVLKKVYLARSHEASTEPTATVFAVLPCLALMAASGRPVIKKELKEVTDRVTALEQHVDRVETTVELAEAYRRLRCEHCPALVALWASFKNKELEAKELRSRVARCLDTEVRKQFSPRNSPTMLYKPQARICPTCKCLPAGSPPRVGLPRPRRRPPAHFTTWRTNPAVHRNSGLRP